MALISYLTDIHFENGALAILPSAITRLQLLRPLIVTDCGVVSSGLLAKLTSMLPGSYAVFDETPGNPTEAAVISAVARYKDAGCDGIIALGGGSPLDLGKGVALMTAHEAPMVAFAAVTGGDARIVNRLPPLVAIPTTAGSGSEVGRATLIVMGDGVKRAIISPSLLPKVTICDPELTLSMSPSLTAGTGMDAITHCVEAFLSPRWNPPADAIALDGLRRGYGAIKLAFHNGKDIGVRGEMLLASLEGGLAFQKGLGAVHALSHALAALPGLHLHHGTLNSVLLPVVLEMNAASSVEKANAVARVLGLDHAAQLPDAFRTLSQNLGLPGRLSEMAVPPGVFPDVAELATRDLSHSTNPTELGLSQYIDILSACY